MGFQKTAAASIVSVLAALIIGLGAVHGASSTRAGGFEWSGAQPVQTPATTATA
ncbi:hypothetical protein KGA66_23150 [Actinocrinis puniceicyclus]|uniref:Uncharacterized protein n=1 Tax=Actinocrinis puniceicyclus TaxID=977794 RepID=A0A8J8BD92_9ACTN|nr:hypothetical protein [Actinocrinis puniceicyclus]MBS2965962.1 hypothetical protein [Actinocrinis puniceicyclus]